MFQRRVLRVPAVRMTWQCGTRLAKLGVNFVRSVQPRDSASAALDAAPRGVAAHRARAGARAPLIACAWADTNVLTRAAWAALQFSLQISLASCHAPAATGPASSWPELRLQNPLGNSSRDPFLTPDHAGKCAAHGPNNAGVANLWFSEISSARQATPVRRGHSQDSAQPSPLLKMEPFPLCPLV